MKEDHIFFVEWSCPNKINKSVRTLSLDRMVVYKRKIIFLSNGRVQIKEINQWDAKF